MRKKLCFTVWLLIPIGLVAFHYGPGQSGIARDRVVAVLQQAQQAEQTEAWAEAVAAYAKALSLLPPADQLARYKVQLAHADARVWIGELPEAIGELQHLMDQMHKERAAPELVREARGKLAEFQYYAGWLMRLEGAETAEWTPEVEQARQHFKWLAEEARNTDQAEAALTNQKNLEAVIRLARMDLSELQALPLPKKCQGCKDCSQKCRSQRASRVPEPKPSEKQEDARGAGVGKRPEGSGS